VVSWVVRIAGERLYLWRPVDHTGEVSLAAMTPRCLFDLRALA
jgi:hypothetical protein